MFYVLYFIFYILYFVVLLVLLNPNFSHVVIATIYTLLDNLTKIISTIVPQPSYCLLRIIFNAHCFLLKLSAKKQQYV